MDPAVSAGTIVVDASVLIAHLDAGDAHHHQAADALRATAGYRLTASTLTLAETLVGPARAGRIEVARSALRRLGVAELPVFADSAVRLAGLRAETKLRLPDCAVLLAAEASAARGILTFDERLAGWAAEFGLSNGPLDAARSVPPGGPDESSGREEVSGLGR